MKETFEMQWGGYTPFSLSDFPGHVSAIAFTQGCNFNCAYCHNQKLIGNTTPNNAEQPSTATILQHLKTRTQQLDGLVVSGGEPTCQPGLVSFLVEVRRLGYKIKLDTNGSHPNTLRMILKKRLVDYIAMDIKAPLQKYTQVTQASCAPSLVEQSVKLLANSKLDFEFRVTAVSPLLEKTDIWEIGKFIDGRGPLFLQKFQPHFAIPNFFCTTEDLDALSSAMNQRFGNCSVR